MGFIQNVKPEAIEQLKTMDSKDLNLVFQNNNSKILKSVGSKENTVASNLNRGQLKNLSDLYFGNEIKGGKLDTARNLLFGGPIIKQGDVPSAILGLEKETEKIVPDLEKPDENILGVFANLPGGPLISGASGDTSGISDSEFRLRSNTAVDNAMQSLGLGGQYTRDATGQITTSKLSDLDGAKFGYVTDLVNVIFNQPDFNFNTYGEVGAKVANIVKDNDRLILSSFQKFKNSGADITPLIPSEDKKSNVLNVDGYNTFIAYNTAILARFANSKSFAYREYVMSTYGGGAYRKYFEEYLKQLEEGSN